MSRKAAQNPDQNSDASDAKEKDTGELPIKLWFDSRDGLESLAPDVDKACVIASTAERWDVENLTLDMGTFVHFEA